jgi:hypothetical protein
LFGLRSATNFYNTQDMWSSLDAILRVALTGSPIPVASLQVISEALRGSARAQGYTTDIGRAQLVVTLTSSLAEGLTYRRPIYPETLVSLVTITVSLEGTMISDGPQAIANGLAYLRTSSQLQSSHRPSVNALTSIAKWVLHWSELYPQVFNDCVKSFVQV